MRRVLAVLTLAVTAIVSIACFDRPAEFGVSVFSADTVPVNFEMTVTGGLVIGLRARTFRPRADKTLLLTTPAQLIIQNGEGTATITSVSGGLLVAQP